MTTANIDLLENGHQKPPRNTPLRERTARKHTQDWLADAWQLNVRVGGCVRSVCSFSAELTIESSGTETYHRCAVPCAHCGSYNCKCRPRSHRCVTSPLPNDIAQKLQYFTPSGDVCVCVCTCTCARSQPKNRAGTESTNRAAMRIARIRKCYGVMCAEYCARRRCDRCGGHLRKPLCVCCVCVLHRRSFDADVGQRMQSLAVAKTAGRFA